VKLDDSLGGSPVQVRVVQGKEPAHFRQLFKGQLVIRTGGVGSGFKNRDTGTEAVSGGYVRLVGGTGRFYCAVG